MASTNDTTRGEVVATGEGNVSGYDLSDERTSDKPAAMRPKDRVRKHRAKLHAQQRRRLEVCVDVSLIEMMTRIATSYQVPLSSAVQKALEVYGEECGDLAAEERRLDEERAQVRWRDQAEAYNRKLAAFNKRLARFLPSDGSSPG